jgi:hypothetical protein
VGVGGREGGLPSSEEESPPEEEGDEGGGEGGIPDPPATGFVFESVGFIVGSMSPNCSLTSEKSKGWLHGRCGCLRLEKELCDLIRDCLKNFLNVTACRIRG